MLCNRLTLLLVGIGSPAAPDADRDAASLRAADTGNIITRSGRIANRSEAATPIICERGGARGIRKAIPMIISVTDDKTADVAPVATSPATIPAAEARDENGMTSDDVFDQLVDENRVVTSGSGSRVPVTDSASANSSTGYSAAVGSGSGSE